MKKIFKCSDAVSWFVLFSQILTSQETVLFSLLNKAVRCSQNIYGETEVSCEANN